MKTEVLNRKMIFVVGNSRSGTTMLGRMLGRNTLVHKFPELHLFGPCIPHGEESRALSKDESIRVFTWLLDVSERKLHATREPGKYVSQATQLSEQFFKTGASAWDLYYHFVLWEAGRNNKAIPCEDLPGNVFKMEQILDKFPEARIVHVVRDPRDVLLSQKNRHRRRKLGGGYVKRKEMLRFWANYHPLLISRLWKNAVTAGLRVQDPRIMTVHFEELLRDPLTEIKKICQHAGIPFEEDMLNVPQVGSSMRKDDPGRLGIDPARSGSWSKGGLDDAEIEICEKMNRDLMLRLGYTLSGKKGGLMDKARLAVLLPLKGSLALTLNWGRTKGRWNYLLKRFLKN